MENDLQIVSEYVSAIIDVLKDPLLVVDLGQNVLFVNQAFCSRFSVTQEQVRGKKVYSIGNGEWDSPKFRKTLEEAVTVEKTFAEHEVTLEFPQIGSRDLVLTTKKITGLTGGTPLIVVIEDITQRKAIEEGLRVSEVRYRKLFETAKDGILIIDPITENIIDVNPYFLEMVEYSFDEIVGKKLWEVGAFKNTALAKESFAELKAKGYAKYEDMPLRTKQDKEIAVEFVSNLYPINAVQMIQCNVRNITDRRKAEKQSAVYVAGIEKMNRLFTGRELKMAELKKEVEELKKKLIPE